MQADKDENEGYENISAEWKVASIVERWINAFNDHDVQRIVSLYTPDAELWDTGMRHAHLGPASIQAWFTQRFQHMPTIQYTRTTGFFQPEAACIGWIAQGHTPALLRQPWLSRPFRVEGVSLFRFNANLIQWQHGYYDHLSIIERILPPLKWLPLKL